MSDEILNAIAALRDDVTSAIAGLRSETASSITALRGETASAIAELRSETATSIADLRHDVSARLDRLTHAQERVEGKVDQLGQDVHSLTRRADITSSRLASIAIGMAEQQVEAAEQHQRLSGLAARVSVVERRLEIRDH